MNTPPSRSALVRAVAVACATSIVACAPGSTSQPAAPVVVVDGTRLLVEGEAVGDISAITAANRMQRIDGLFTHLKATRDAWKAAHQNDAFTDAVVEACVTAGFAKLELPAPEGGIVTVVYPINFTPGD